METSFIVDSHPQYNCAVRDVAMMLATWNVTVIQAASNGHAVVVYSLADVVTCVKIVACF